MKIVEFLPYYDELRTGGHMAVALASAFVGGAGMWIAAWAFSDVNRDVYPKNRTELQGVN